MSTIEQSRQTVYAENDRSLDTLIRAITLSQHQFALILVRCNYTRLRNYLMQRLRERCPLHVHEYTLPETATTLYTKIRTEMKDSGQECETDAAGTFPAQSAPAPQRPLQRPAQNVAPSCQPPNALMIFGLESVMAIDQVLVATNLVREELSK